MRTPFFEMDGLRPRPRFFADYMRNSIEELEGRTLSRIVKYGVSEGLDVSSATTALVTGVNVTSGLAYDVYGRRVRLGATTFLALDNSDDGRYVVISRTQVSSHVEAHPITAVTSYTKVEDSSVLSAVVVPSAALGHVRLALIQDVRDFPSSVLLRAIDLVDRDPMLLSSPFPYAVIGPSGDTQADFAGDDEAPFRDALESLTATSGGIIYVKRNVYDLSGGIAVSGFQSVALIGQGRGTSLRGAGPLLRVFDNDDLALVGLTLSTTTASEGVANVRRTSRVLLEDCYVSGGATATWALELVSGIDEVVVRGNTIIGNGVAPWKASGAADASSIGRVVMEANWASGAVVQFNEAITDLSIRSNTLYDVDVDEETIPA